MSESASGERGPRGSRRFVRWYVRMPLKGLVFTGVTFFVLFPDPVRFVRHLGHLSDLEAMVESDAPQLAEWEDELSARLAADSALRTGGDGPHAAEDDGSDARRVQKAIEAFVYQKVRYGWDWEVWGSADYLPTVGEMFEQAAGDADGQMREDCDGQALMAASLMRRMGYESAIVTDLRHVWVATPEGEWMGPGRSKTLISTSEGNRSSILHTLNNVPVALSYGLAVFPLGRELIILVTAFVLVLHRGMKRRTIAFGALLLLQGLLFMRLGYLAPSAISRQVSSWPSWWGGLHLLSGFGVLLWSSRRARQSAV
ncbi:MAG: hypothetical protein ACE5EC_04435 [Phycisphaerae bacterium]